MGHKRHRIKGDFTNVNPGRGGPGITEDGYPPHLVVVSVEHPEINPKGVTIESFTEEVTEEEEVFGTNVGEAIENLINEETNQDNNINNQEDKTMNNEEQTKTNETINANTNKENANSESNQNNKETINASPNNKVTETISSNNTNKGTETTNNEQNKHNKENVNMNTANPNNTNVNSNGTIDDGSNSNNNVNQKPSLAKEAASAFVVGAAYGAGTITAVIGISLLAAGIRKLCCGDATTAGDAAATAETTETVETVAEALLR